MTTCTIPPDLYLEYEYPNQGVFVGVAVCTSSLQLGASVSITSLDSHQTV